jgi:hypothetical protein
MNTFTERPWPPTKSRKLSVLWALLFGFVLQIALPLFLVALGVKRLALFAMYPGFLPIIWSTHGWFAGISSLGYVLVFTVNTLGYAILLLSGFRACACLQRQYE